MNEKQQIKQDLIRYAKITSDLIIEEANVRVRTFFVNNTHWYLYEKNGEIIELYQLGMDL